MKLSLKKTWLCRLLQDLSPTASGASKGIVCNGITKYGHLDDLPLSVRIACIVFALVGVLGTLRFFVDLLLASAFFQNLVMNINQPTTEPEECLSNHVIDELTNRMHMLEMAFKEQVFARETISREITDQSDFYESMDKKLELFLEKLSNVSRLYEGLEAKHRHLSDRVYSDEFLGLFVVLILMVQLFCMVRPYFQTSVDKMAAFNPSLARLVCNGRTERKTSSNPGTPKHSAGLRNETCVVCFQRDSTNGLISKLTDAMMRHLEGVKLTVKPFFTVFSAEDIRIIPHVKLYVIVVDLESRGVSINCQEKDLVLMAVKHINSIGAQYIVVIINDEGSKNLTAHSAYNSSIRLIKTNDCLQDLAANGRLFSIWQEMTSHQLSHMRRIIKTVLNAKLVIK